MRSIGKRNIRLVKEITQEELSKPDGYKDIEERVIDRLPSSIFDIWEMAYQQICGIIEEVVNQG